MTDRPPRKPAASRTPDPWYADGLRFECTQCGKCCRNHGDDFAFVYLGASEADAMAKHLGLDLGRFKTRYTTLDEGDLVLKDNGDKCIFLGDDNRCEVYEARPRQCRTWPFWSDNLEEKEWRGPVKTLCPGIDSGTLYPREEIERLAAWTDEIFEDDDAADDDGDEDEWEDAD